MKIEYVNSANGNLIINLDGEMDALCCSKIRPQLEAIADTEHAHIILDINNICFIDSSGIGAIVFLFKRLKTQGRSMELIGVRGQPHELLTLLRIDTAIPISLVASSDKLQGVSNA